MTCARGCNEKTIAMTDHELTPEEGFRRLHELFGAEDPSAPPTRTHRKYVLEYADGKPVFRRADSQPALARDEIELALDQIFDRELGNDIVPQKLAKLFPGSSEAPLALARDLRARGGHAGLELDWLVRRHRGPAWTQSR